MKTKPILAAAARAGHVTGLPVLKVEHIEVPA